MKVSIIGATGYTGAELLRLLHQHPEAELLHLTSESSTGQTIDSLYPHLRTIASGSLISLNDIDAIAESDAVFIALPHGHAMELGKKLAGTKVKIIDLGADYRFKDESVYEAWYKLPHTHSGAGAVYGLPEWYRSDIRTAQIIGNPGCYTTASILALAPLMAAGLIEPDSIIIDAKSGVSGAGRSLKIDSHFAEMYENLKAYNIAGHRHTPEIEQALGDIGQTPVTLTFTPHLIPMTRGILSTCYAKLKQPCSLEALTDVFTAKYQDEPFVRLLGAGAYPATKATRGSNFCDLGWHIDSRSGRVIVVSAIDNLVKGAAGQAVQNLNILFGLPETMGLNQAPMYP